MSYRNIEVDSVNYQYSIGRSHTKIKIASTGKQFGVFQNSHFGNQAGQTFVVTPATVRRMIDGKSGPRVMHCETHDHYTTQLTADPFEAEIYGRVQLMMNCPSCVKERAWDI